MPVDFLTAEQRRRFGRFCGELSAEELGRYFHFDKRDLAFIGNHRGSPNRLGVAVQLGTVRCLGTFLADPTDVPTDVVSYVKQGLKLPDKTCLDSYKNRPSTYCLHARQIKQRYGYRDFSDQAAVFSFVRWLYTKAWYNPERPSALFDRATIRLVKGKILLPGLTTLVRLIARVRQRTSERLWRTLASISNIEQTTRLKALLSVPSDDIRSHLDRLRHGPVRNSGPALVEALQRFEEIRALGVGDVDLAALPLSRLENLARYAATASAQTIGRMAEDRQIATLVAFAHVFQTEALDDALDVIDLLIDDLRKEAEALGKSERLRTIGDLDAAALQLLDVCQIVMDTTCPNSQIRTRALAAVTRAELEQSIEAVKKLARRPNHNYRKEFVERYGRVQIFLPSLLQSLKFDGTSAAQGVLEAVRFLGGINGQREPDMSTAPLDFVPQSWLEWVRTEDGTVDRRAYTVCALERLQDGLRRRDVFVKGADRWGDPHMR
jgi:hypothetical protein